MWGFGFFCTVVGLALSIYNLLAPGTNLVILAISWICIIIGIVGLFFADA